MSITLFPPEPGKVRNLPPKGRQGRRRCREEIEKTFLRGRVEGFQRYGKEIEEPFGIEKSACMYMDDGDRFHTDTAGEAKKERQQDRDYKQALWNAKLRDNADRENQRWAGMEKQAREQEERFAVWRATGQKYRNNTTSAPFNPVTLGIEVSSRGDALRQNDEMIRYRAMVRMKSLNDRNNGAHNPITGAPLPSIDLPRRPPPPVEYHSEYYPHSDQYL